MNSEQLLYELSNNLANSLKKQGKTITCTESCTGGWIAKVMTDISGSSAYFQRGFVIYSHEAKHDMLGVSKNTLHKYGAVSEQVVIEMAERALASANADFAVSVSGIAGPDGGTDEKPVGTVWFGFASKSLSVARIVTRCFLFKGDCIQIRRQAVRFSLTTLMKGIIKN
ncbi:hypothetical protein BBD39_08765 [Arsenophonus endosymbiont of Bemisia tabaci Asia II 3]|nr:hypothetical protein BBD39_08765 [Arsenophonus endosymbiont of Bemisia tabaci Asia II 3]